MTITFTFDEEDFDPASLPTRDGKPIKPGDELAANGKYFYWKCNDCLYCRGEFWRGREKYPAFCWQQDPEGPPAPQPVKIFQKACEEFVVNPRGSMYDRMWLEARTWERPPRLVFVRDGESFNSGKWYDVNDPEYLELIAIKGTNWL